jgi:hypothetical protein
VSTARTQAAKIELRLRKFELFLDRRVAWPTDTWSSRLPRPGRAGVWCGVSVGIARQKYGHPWKRVVSGQIVPPRRSPPPRVEFQQPNGIVGTSAVLVTSMGDADLGFRLSPTVLGHDGTLHCIHTLGPSQTRRTSPSFPEACSFLVRLMAAGRPAPSIDSPCRTKHSSRGPHDGGLCVVHGRVNPERTDPSARPAIVDGRVVGLSDGLFPPQHFGSRSLAMRLHGVASLFYVVRKKKSTRKHTDSGDQSTPRGSWAVDPLSRGCCRLPDRRIAGACNGSTTASFLLFRTAPAKPYSRWSMTDGPYDAMAGATIRRSQLALLHASAIRAVMPGNVHAPAAAGRDPGTALISIEGSSVVSCRGVYHRRPHKRKRRTFLIGRSGTNVTGAQYLAGAKELAVTSRSSFALSHTNPRLRCRTAVVSGLDEAQSNEFGKRVV